MFIEDNATSLALIVLTDDMHDGGGNVTMNEPPPESLRQPEDSPPSQLRELAECVVALREHDKIATPAYAHFDKEIVLDHAVQQPTDLMKVPAGFIG